MRWRCRRLRPVDWISVALADTHANQQEYPQPGEQKSGCGFPVMRLLVLQDVASGFILNGNMFLPTSMAAYTNIISPVIPNVGGSISDMLSLIANDPNPLRLFRSEPRAIIIRHISPLQFEQKTSLRSKASH